MEEPTGPSFDDVKMEETAGVNATDLLQANLTLMGTLLTTTIWLGYTQFIANSVTDYTDIMT